MSTTVYYFRLETFIKPCVTLTVSSFIKENIPLVLLADSEKREREREKLLKFQPINSKKMELPFSINHIWCSECGQTVDPNPCSEK